MYKASVSFYQKHRAKTRTLGGNYRASHIFLRKLDAEDDCTAVVSPELYSYGNGCATSMVRALLCSTRKVIMLDFHDHSYVQVAATAYHSGCTHCTHEELAAGRGLSQHDITTEE